MGIRRLICALLGHRYVVKRRFSATSRKVGCTRCDCSWGMNDSVRAFIPWDGELEQLYRDLGQWPGLPRAESPAQSVDSATPTP